MKNYRLLILQKLLDKYENSKAYTDPSSHSRGIYLRYNRDEFEDYWVDTSADYRLEIDRVSKELAGLGIIRIHWPRHARGEYIEKVSLCLERIDEAYRLARRTPRQEKEAGLLTIVGQWLECWQSDPHFPRWPLDFLSAIHESLLHHTRLPAGFRVGETELLDEICRCIDTALRLETEVPKRVFSLEVFRDSKRFENIEKRLVRVLREHYPDAGDYEEPAQLLNELGLVDNPQHVFLAGPLTLEFRGVHINVNHFEPDLGLPAPMILDCEITSLDAERVITVENLTSFYQLAMKKPPRTLLVYLGGYHNRLRRSFLLKLGQYAQQQPDLIFQHWGDLDLGGFQIFQHLKQRTGLPLQPYRMDRNTYLQHLSYGVSFDAGYRKKLAALLDKPEYELFHEVIREMLAKGKRIEQECVK